MGASNSKRHQSTLKSFRYNQLDILTRHRQYLEEILRAIERHEDEELGTRRDYRRYESNLVDIEGELCRMKRFIKVKNKKKHEYLLNMTHDLMKMLKDKSKAKRVDYDNNNTSVGTIDRKTIERRVAADDPPNDHNSVVRLKLIRLKSRDEDAGTLERTTLDDQLYAIRKSIEDVKPKIYLFGGTSKSFEYCVLLQEINNIKMDLLRIHDESQEMSMDSSHLRHEQTVAFREIDECLNLLDSKASFNEVTPYTRAQCNKDATVSEGPSIVSKSPSPVGRSEITDVVRPIETTKPIAGDDDDSSSDDDYDNVYESDDGEANVKKSVAVTSF